MTANIAARSQNYSVNNLGRAACSKDWLGGAKYQTWRRNTAHSNPIKPNSDTLPIRLVNYLGAVKGVTVTVGFNIYLDQR